MSRIIYDVGFFFHTLFTWLSQKWFPLLTSLLASHFLQGIIHGLFVLHKSFFPDLQELRVLWVLSVKSQKNHRTLNLQDSL